MDAWVSQERAGRRRTLLIAGGLAAGGMLALAATVRRGAAPRTVATGYVGETMGTSWTLKVGAAVPAARFEAAAADVQAALTATDARMSLYRADSELVRLNAHGTTPFAASRELLEVLAAAQRIAALSDGAFDATVEPLVRAWGFGTEKRREVPEPGRVQAGRARVGWRALRVDAPARTVHKAHASLALDLNGIAKGYGVDRAAAAIEALGIDDYLLEVGGEVRARGRNTQGEAWRVGIEEPDAWPPRARRVVAMRDGALATSGDYRIYFEAGGRRYAHEIDPATGAPIAHGLASVSVRADDCMSADALATALIVAGPRRGLALAEREGLAAHFIAREGGGLREFASRAFLAAA